MSSVIYDPFDALGASFMRFEYPMAEDYMNSNCVT